MEIALSTTFTDASVRRLRQYLDRITQCAGMLTQQQLWARGNANCNSTGNLILHLTGNVRQWILSGVAGQADIRERDREFRTQGGIDSEELLQRLSETVTEACVVIASLSGEGLVARRVIQGYDVTVLEAVYHVVEHFAMHAGQIILLTKLATGEDLGFYRHIGGAHSHQTP